jgi:homoserine kinase type II
MRRLQALRSALVLLALAAAPAIGQNRMDLQPLPAVPPPPPEMAPFDASLEPEVTIKKREGDTVEEHRINGKLYRIKVTPEHGVPYYLTDRQGDGNFTRKRWERRTSACRPGSSALSEPTPCGIPLACRPAAPGRHVGIHRTERRAGERLAGELCAGQPGDDCRIAEGVQNSNFFLDTTLGQYVLTIFEQEPGAQLPFHMQLLAHLSARGIPCPAPVANRRQEYLGQIAGKPAAIVSRLPGCSRSVPEVGHCAAIGNMLARLHLAAESYPEPLAHQRHTAWCAQVAAQLEPCLADDDARLLRNELRHQQRYRPADLPRGVIHADLFRDNVLFVGDQVSGLLDFYFAGVDDLLFDLAVTVNDWCTTADGGLDAQRSAALLAAYDHCRPLLAAERRAWPTMLRAAALRFWISRLQDHHLPRPGSLVIRRDPDAYRAILLTHMASDASQVRLATSRPGG